MNKSLKHITATALLGLALAVITGCSFNDLSVPAVGYEGVNSPLTLRVFDESTTSATAAFSGNVLLKGGCVALEVEGNLYTVVWVDVRTSWDPELQQVTMRRSGGLADLTATVGEFEDLGGQLIEEDWETIDWIDWAVKPGPDCPRNVAVI